MSAAELVIDKSDWGSGPWSTEPDRVEFIHAGFACLIVRHPEYGHLCGYVGVPNGHPCYGKGYDDVDVDVHGGLTYADKCRDHICHTPRPGIPDDVWWLGFDAAHLFDASPGRLATVARLGFALNHDEDIYRDMPFMRRETEQLAEQFAAMAKPVGPSEAN